MGIVLNRERNEGGPPVFRSLGKRGEKGRVQREGKREVRSLKLPGVEDSTTTFPERG